MRRIVRPTLGALVLAALPPAAYAQHPMPRPEIPRVETARPEPQVHRLGVDDDLVSDLDRAHQADVRPRPPARPFDLDRQRIELDDNPSAQLQQRAAVSVNSASQTSSI